MIYSSFENELLRCHICSLELLVNPLYEETVSKYCPDDGDFFIQSLSGKSPVMVFRPFESVSIDDKQSVVEKASSFKKKTIEKTGRTSRWSYFGRVGRQAGHPGYITRCDQTGLTFPSSRKAAEVMGLSATGLSRHLNGKQATVGGYTFTNLGDNIGNLID